MFNKRRQTAIMLEKNIFLTFFDGFGMVLTSN